MGFTSFNGNVALILHTTNGNAAAESNHKFTFNSLKNEESLLAPSPVFMLAWILCSSAPPAALGC